MLSSSPATARHHQRLQGRMQTGRVLSFTTLSHPPHQFGSHPRTIGIIELQDGTRITAPLLSSNIKIGMSVQPRMRLSFINDHKLRVYEVAFEPLILQQAPVAAPQMSKHILALTGPSGVGKYAVMQILLQNLSEYVLQVPMITTLPRSETERGEYRHVSIKKFQEWLKSGEIVAATDIQTPHGKHWCGYRGADIEAVWDAGKLPVVSMQLKLLRSLSTHYGRQNILSFGLLPPGKSRRAMLSHLLRTLRAKGRGTEAWLKQWVNDAATDLHGIRAYSELFDHVLVNSDTEVVVKTLKKHLPHQAK